MQTESTTIFITLATLSIHGAWSALKQHLLNSFIHRNNIDILALQEVVYTDFQLLRGYQAHANIGDSGRGMAIVTKQGIQLQDIDEIPSRRAIAADFRSYRVANLYAPSGHNRRQERRNFFEEDIAYLLRKVPRNIIETGYFNSVQGKADCTGEFQPCTALRSMFGKLSLVDPWKSQSRCPIYTHNSASILHRIYISKQLTPKITRTEVILAPFTDHNAFAAHITLRCTYVDKGPSYWKMNTRVLYNESTKNEFASQWERWKRYKLNFPTATLWWKLVIKTKIRSFFKRVSAGYVRKLKKEENHTTKFVYGCINDLITKDKVTKYYQQIKLCKAHILRIQKRRLEKLKITGKSSQVADDERKKLYNLIAEKNVGRQG
jgi:hypothetical protein